MRVPCTLSLVMAVFLVTSAGGAERTRGLSVVRAPTGKPIRGQSWLLVIGINDYKHWFSLDGPTGDAKKLKEVLLDRYVFDAGNVVELYDKSATHQAISRTLREFLEKKLRVEDSLVIFYAGHGYKDGVTGLGYWIPHDGGIDTFSKERWLSNDEIRAILRKMACKHVLVIADSCYSGDLLDLHRGTLAIKGDYFYNAYSRRARQVLTSGASEPVADRSEFAFHLIDALGRNDRAYLDPLQLYVDIREGVTKQTPLVGSLRDSGHQVGASYLFFLREPKEGGAVTPEPPRPIQIVVAPSPGIRPAGPWTILVFATDATSDFVVRGVDAGADWVGKEQETGFGIRAGYGIERGRASIHLEAGLESSQGAYADSMATRHSHQRLHTYAGARAAIRIRDELRAHVSAGYGFFQSQIDDDFSVGWYGSAHGQGPHIGLGIGYALNPRADIHLEWRWSDWKGTLKSLGENFPMEEIAGGVQIGLAAHF